MSIGEEMNDLRALNPSYDLRNDISVNAFPFPHGEDGVCMGFPRDERS